MILQNSGRSFESERSLNQDLSFNIFKNELKQRDIENGEVQMKILKLFGEDNLYSNLALLLSDQCPVTTKIAVFQGSNKAIFRERREFTGSILKQIEEGILFIDFFNNTKATFSGINRIDTRDYPEEAIREAWLNCFVHRDYASTGSTMINIYDDRMEFVSQGGLVSGLTLDSVFIGASKTRNPNLAALFYRMRIIECYGTGIEKILRCYDDVDRKPIFETAPGVFRVTLPNINEISTKEAKKATYSDYDILEKEKYLILEHVAKYGEITRKETEDVIDSGTTKAFKVLKELCKGGKLKAIGSGKKVKYVLE